MMANLLTFVSLLTFGFQFAASEEPLWSLCSDIATGECLNAKHPDNTGWVCGLSSRNATGFTGRGLHVFIPNNIIGEFIFQEEFGDYQPLAETSNGDLSCIGRYGDPSNFSRPLLTLSEGPSLLANVNVMTFDERCVESCGTSSRRTFKSLTIQGAASWTLVGITPEHRICIQARDTSSLVPAIVTDTREFGFDDNDWNISQVIFGCPSGSGNVMLIDNSRTRGALHRR